MTHTLSSKLTLRNEATVGLKRVATPDEVRYMLSLNSELIYITPDELRAVQDSIDMILECGK